MRGRGAESRHNLIYWRYGEYAGVGPGAHGRILAAGGRRAQACERDPEGWLAAVEAGGHGLIEDSGFRSRSRATSFC